MGFGAEARAADLDLPFDPEEEQEVAALATYYRQAYDHLEKLNAKVKKAGARKRYIAEKLYDALNAAGLESVKTEEGSFGLDLKKKCGALAPGKEQLFDWLEENSLGDAIKRDVHFQTLNKLYREDRLDVQYLKDNKIITTWEEKAIRIRRS